MLPHFRVHGRGHEYGAVSGHQQGVGEEVIGLAGGRAGQEIGGGRSHDDQFGLMPEADMVDGVDGVEHAVADRVAGKGLPRGNADEPGGRLGGDDRDVMAGFSKKPEERRHLVGGNPSPDSEDYAHVISVSRQSVYFALPAKGITLRLRSAWKRACLR